MSTELNDDENEQPKESADIRQLRKKAERVDELEKLINDYKQKDAISAAKLTDLTEAQIKAVLAVHEGEQTPDLLRKTAEDLKFVEPEPEVDPVVQAAHQQLQDASKGAQAVDPTSYEAAIAAANTPAEVQAVAAKFGMAMASST